MSTAPRKVLPSDNPPRTQDKEKNINPEDVQKEKADKATMSIRPNITPLEIEGTPSSNLSIKWKNWIKQFRLFIVAAGFEEETEKRKVALLLSLIGEQGMSVFNSFEIDEGKVKLQDLISKFDAHFNPKKNTTVERHNFFSRQQKLGEPIDEYVTVLKNLAATCELGLLKDSLVMDALILGLHRDNVSMKIRLLQEEDLTLDSAVKICRSE